MSVQLFDDKNLYVQTVVLKSKILADVLKKLADKHHYLVRLEKRRRRSFPERAKIASDFGMVLKCVKKSYRSFLQEIFPFLTPEMVPNIRAQPKALEANTEPKAPNSSTESKKPNSSAESKNPTFGTKSKSSSSGTKLKKLSSKIKSSKLNFTSETENESDRKVRQSAGQRCLMPGRHFLSALHSISEPEQLICDKKVLNFKKELEGFFAEVDLYFDDMPKRNFLSTPKSKPEPTAPLFEPERSAPLCKPEYERCELEREPLSSESESEAESEPEKVNLKPKNEPKALNSESSSKSKSVEEIVSSEINHKNKPEAHESKSDTKELRNKDKSEAQETESDLKELHHKNKPEAQQLESKSQAMRSKSKAETQTLKPEPETPKPEDGWETVYYESESEAENFKAARKALNTRFEAEIREVIAREMKAMRRRKKKLHTIPQKMVPITYRPEDGELHYDAVRKSVRARRPIGLTSKADRKEFRRQMRCLPQDSDSSPERDNYTGKRVLELYNIKKPNCLYKPKYPIKPMKIKK